MKSTNLLELMSDRKTRIQMCSKSLYLFAIYYYREYFTHTSPEFHKDRAKVIQNLWEIGWPRFIVDCEFRWSAKTSYVKIDFARRICYRDRKMMVYGSLDKKNAENALLDIALELQTNQRIIDDFWQLFFDDWLSEKRSKKQWVTNFLTTNWVRVQAITTQQPIRWLVFWKERPDYLVYDDFENNSTKKSNKKTRAVIWHFDEMFPAIAPYWIVIFCCNKISDTWSVAWLYDKFEWSKDWTVFEKAVEEDWEITWKSKYVATDKEAFDINTSITDKSKTVFSLESLKRDWNKDWRKVYEQEMLNQPIADWERFFDIELIDQEIERCKKLEFEKQGNWKIWEEYDPMCDYKIWWDVSEWYWLDSSTIEIINIDTWNQAAEYESSQIPPWLLADEYIDASANYNKCSVTPERNSIWNAVITSIQEKGFGNILTTQKVLNSKTRVRESRYGWNTNHSSKAKMLFDFQTDFNNWSLIINSVPLLREMRAFTNWDLQVVSFDDEVSNHFDRLIGMAITNQAKTQEFFAIWKKKVKIGEESAPNWLQPVFRGWKWKLNRH